jgi:hypothetical protein
MLAFLEDVIGKQLFEIILSECDVNIYLMLKLGWAEQRVLTVFQQPVQAEKCALDPCISAWMYPLLTAAKDTLRELLVWRLRTQLCLCCELRLEAITPFVS